MAMDGEKVPAHEMMRQWLASGDGQAWSQLAASLNALARRGDFTAVLEVFEDTIKAFPGHPILYYNAARVCEAWADALTEAYFSRKQTSSMSLCEWMAGEGTPYPKFKGLMQCAADYLRTFLELSPDLDAETRETVEEKIFWLGWA